MTAFTRVFLVDDDTGFRDTTSVWLDTLGHKVTAYGDPSDFLADKGLTDRSGRYCCLLDVRMPGLTGLQVMDALTERGATLPVVMLSGHADISLAVEAMQRGAVTFLEKPLDAAALEDALQQASHIVCCSSGEDEETRLFEERLDQLTPRERQVFDRIVEGMMNKTIAYKLGISIKTVELHRKRTMEKLQAVSLSHLLRMAMTGRIQEPAQ